MPSKHKRDIVYILSWRANAWKFFLTFGGFKDVEYAKLDALRDYYLYVIKQMRWYSYLYFLCSEELHRFLEDLIKV